MIGIYKMVFPSGACYVGQSNDISRRFKEHLTSMSEGIHTNRLIREHYADEGYPTMSVLEECGLMQLNEREIAWIVFLDSYRCGLNLNKGGGVKRVVNVPGKMIPMPSAAYVPQNSSGWDDYIVPIIVFGIVAVGTVIILNPAVLVAIAMVVGFVSIIAMINC